MTKRLRETLCLLGLATCAEKTARLAPQLGLQAIYDLVQAFLAMVHDRTGEKLDAWLDQVRESQIPELIRFGKGIERDKAPVQAALQLPYSNGVVEGHVHRLKLVKRQGYGRAAFPLLRKRVLASSSKAC